MHNVDFKKYGTLIGFDDGHIPEGVKKNTKIFQSNDEKKAQNENVPPSVQIYKDALPPHLCQQIYDHTAERERPWGTYITREEAMQCQPGSESGSESSTDNSAGSAEHANAVIQKLAASAVRHFIFSNHNEHAHDLGESEGDNHYHYHSSRIQQISGPRLTPNKNNSMQWSSNLGSSRSDRIFRSLSHRLC